MSDNAVFYDESPGYSPDFKCSRCGEQMPIVVEWINSEGKKCYQSTDGHNATVMIGGGYAEFIDTFDDYPTIGTLCHKCGHDLLAWLNYDHSQTNEFGKWFGHPKEPDSFCNGWSIADYKNKESE
jgi:hypothetical protein